MHPEHYLAEAERHCAANGVKLTSVRRQVLELVLRHTGVIKAYQLLADLQRERGVAAPPTVYRALDFLVEQGLLHKVDALNGYIVCQRFDCCHAGLILACTECGAVQELDAASTLAAMGQSLSGTGFVPAPQNLLITGLCQACTR